MSFQLIALPLSYPNKAFGEIKTHTEKYKKTTSMSI